MRAESIRLPSKLVCVRNVWRRNFLLFRRFWLINLFWIVLEPLIVLIAIGYGLGSYISNIGGVSYAEFFFPALLCISSMMVAFFESTYGNFAKLTYQKTYSTMMLAPIDPEQIVWGEILWAATKGTFSAIGVAVVAGLFGHLNTWMILPAIIILFISSFMFSALGFLITSYVKNYDQIIYPTSGIIIPMSLLSGTYFPLTEMPFGLQHLSFLMPLRHTVSAVRGCLLGGIPWWQILIHIFILIVFSVGLTRWATIRIRRRLIQ